VRPIWQGLRLTFMAPVVVGVGERCIWEVAGEVRKLPKVKPDMNFGLNSRGLFVRYSQEVGL